MHVILTPQLEAMVRQKVESGRYDDASAVVRDALRLLAERDDDRDSLHRLRAAIAIGQDQLDRGEGREYTPKLHDEIIEAARRKAREGTQPHPDVLP